MPINKKRDFISEGKKEGGEEGEIYIIKRQGWAFVTEEKKIKRRFRNQRLVNSQSILFL
ncbi:MAG: hypothetical protein AB1595_03885 [bacterium]